MSKVMLCVLMFVATTAVASTETFYKTYLPAGVTIGMSLEQVRTARPQAIRNQLPSPSASNPDTALLEMVEITPQGNTRVAYWYRFKGGKLGAVTRSIATARMPIEHAQAGASKVAEELRADFALKGEEQVVRTTGTENTVLTAQRWEDSVQGLNLYFVTTNREITVVVFDPKTFGKADFFLGPERMKDLDAQVESVRRLTEKSAATPIPIIDLVPKIIAASSPEATPIPISQKGTQWSASRTLVPVVGGVVIVAIVALLMRRRGP